MPYLLNAAVNRLNIHTALHSFAWSFAGNFFIAYLLAKEFSSVAVLLFLAAMFGMRLLLRPLVLKLALRFGTRYVLCLGVIFFGLQYFVLSFVNGGFVLFAVYCLCCAVADVFYWMPYHAMYAFTADNAHRAKQIGVREAASTVANIVAPLAGGFAIDKFGAHSTFFLGMLIEFLAIVPLLRVPDLPVAKIRPEGSYKATRDGAMIFITDGIIGAGIVFAWQMKVYGATGPNFTTFGGATALAGLMVAMGGLLLGRALDSRHAARTVVMNGAFLLTLIVLRAVVAPQLADVFGVTAITSLLLLSYNPTLMTAIYALAAKSPCILRYTFTLEGVWDIGCSVTCIIMAGLLHIGMTIGFALGACILGAATQTILLWRYYRRRT